MLRSIKKKNASYDYDGKHSAGRTGSAKRHRVSRGLEIDQGYLVLISRNWGFRVVGTDIRSQKKIVAYVPALGRKSSSRVSRGRERRR